MFVFDNSYGRLPGRFYTRMAPMAVAAPDWVALNDGLARELGLNPDDLRAALDVFAGNRVPDGADPLAQLYAGHQFGGWSPQLGDGRALLLGEHVGPAGRVDVQLKGSGPTPYSRMGDGRAALGPVIREYLVSEAMHALGVPTTRALAAVTTGETVLRQEGPLPGGVLTRVATSHIRVGTFQVFAARDDVDGLQALLDHALSRHAPGAEGPMGLLRHVMAVQAKLVAQWMGLGFIHGVMNTDNMTISGETIDYGPCAFMDSYH
ncbi:MAG: protein adenylyltransferase SelO family protein, partial [Pseudomonadota bacterium]